MTHTPTPENRAKIDKILEPNAKDVASVMSASMTKEERADLNLRWRERLAEMRQIDPIFCHFAGFKMYD
ncbi:MAG: hypothetical protein KAJ19_26815 [Gammaproteobacteria bacterium]|nr:hypothetical protein [Gammaproteobacteria bacterium]